MPSYNSKSQNRSQSQSKNGGRRRKHTMKKYRRGKSRKIVMVGGNYTSIQIMEGYNKLDKYKKADFLNRMGPMYIDDQILNEGISRDVSTAIKAINLLKEYKILQ